MLDMDTGGGEKLLSLHEYWPARVVATEDYPPNVTLATERLSRLGVQVIYAGVSDFNSMRFEDGEFDLVPNRHAPFNSSEVARILSVGGTFLAQQMHGMWPGIWRTSLTQRPNSRVPQLENMFQE